MQKPLPLDWLASIERNVPYYSYLTFKERRELQGLVQVFLDEKRFEGCGGLEISDEIRLTIAAQACILLLGRQTDFYPKLRSILVYPHAYVAPATNHHPDGTVSEGFQHRLGESWSQGNVVLSWADVLRRASSSCDGRNVVFHEFAHQLDGESGSCNGAPILPEPSMYADWARVLGADYDALVDAVEQGKTTLVDKYGATNPAEFFAVVTELFFEKPLELDAGHPELYGQLKLYYRQDPASLMRKRRTLEPCPRPE